MPIRGSGQQRRSLYYHILVLYKEGRVVERPLGCRAIVLDYRAGAVDRSLVSTYLLRGDCLLLGCRSGGLGTNESRSLLA